MTASAAARSVLRWFAKLQTGASEVVRPGSALRKGRLGVGVGVCCRLASSEEIRPGTSQHKLCAQLWGLWICSQARTAMVVSRPPYFLTTASTIMSVACRAA